jgi:hypothetical protein
MDPSLPTVSGAAEGAVLPALAAAAASAGNVAAVGAVPLPPIDRTAQWMGVIAWPLAALLIALMFRKPLAAFVSSLGGRVTKLSLFSFGIELAPAAVAGTGELVQDVRSGGVAAAAPGDSAALMQQEVMSTARADYALIDLRDGTEWITSRLYFAAVLLPRMRGVKAFLFVGDGPRTKRSFVALVGAARLRHILAYRDPLLEGAWLSVVGPFFPKPHVGATASLAPPAKKWPPGHFHLATETGAFQTYAARDLFMHFRAAVRTHPPGAKAAPPGWLDFGSKVWERAEWVTLPLLEAILPAEAFGGWVPTHGRSRGELRKAVAAAEGEFVALVDTAEERRFLQVVDRRAMLEAAAISLAEG